tara:strand:- start:985 stop:1254 length:270 start_codon:yes stop_codon:yes gene_type:complete
MVFSKFEIGSILVRYVGLCDDMYDIIEVRKEVRQMPQDINLEPNWEAVFSYAIQLVKDGLPKAEGRDTVTEMLEYGQRLHNARMFPPAS